MALERTVIAVANNKVISFWDRHLRVKLSEVTAANTVWGMEYDYDRELLWVISSSGVERINFTNAANPVLTATGITGDLRNSGKALDKSTGSLYLTSKTTAYSTSATMYKLLADGTLNATLKIPSAQNMGTLYTAGDTPHVVKQALVFDPISQSVVVNYPVMFYNDGSHVSSVSTYLEVAKDLSTSNQFVTSSLLSLVTYGSTGNIYKYRLCYKYSSDLAYEEVPTNIFINKVTGQINTFFDYAGTGKKLVVEIPNIPNKMLTVKELDSIGIPNSEVRYITQDNASGDYIIEFSNLELWRVDALFTRAWSIGAISGTVNTTAINQTTSELYIKNSSNVYMFDSACIMVAQTPVGAQTDTTKIAVCPWLGESVPNGANPARIVYPYSGISITDTTPTIIMKVGTNLSGWTQQFRLCADTDSTVLNDNSYDYAYGRVFDSWAAGASYDATAVWEYSLDYDETDVNPLNGTWATLGTGDGLQTGGTVPTNGVDANTANVHVRITLPDAKALTGADSNQKWYFKVYSYSKQ